MLYRSPAQHGLANVTRCSRLFWDFHPDFAAATRKTRGQVGREKKARALQMLKKMGIQGTLL